jgi:hypothetical protein
VLGRAITGALDRERMGRPGVAVRCGRSGLALDIAYPGRTQPRLSETAGTAGPRSRDPIIGRCGRSGPDSLRGGAPRVLCFFFYRSGLPRAIDSRFRVDGSPGAGNKTRSGETSDAEREEPMPTGPAQ